MSIFGSMPANFQLPSLLNLSKLNFKISPTQQKAITKKVQKQKAAATKAAAVMPKAQAEALQKSITKSAMSLLGDTPAQRKIAAEQLQTGSAITPSMMESLSKEQKRNVAGAIAVSQSPEARAAKKTALAAGVDPRVVDATAAKVAAEYGGLGAGTKELKDAGTAIAEALAEQRQTESALAPVREQSQAAAEAAAKRIRRTSLVRFTPMSLTRQKGKGAVALDEDDKSFFGSYL